MSRTYAPITQCKECGSSALTWYSSNLNRSDVQQGRLRTGDVECVHFLGCDECSETLAMVGIEQLTALLNSPVLQVRRTAARREVEISDSVLAVVWQAAMTAACNHVIDTANERNADDCRSDVSEALGDAIGRIKHWLQPDAEYLQQLRELIASAAVEPDEEVAR